MAMRLQEMDSKSASQSVYSDKDESDHLEVHNTFKYRGKAMNSWKRLVKANATMYLLFSLVCAAYLFFLSSTKHYHNWIVLGVAVIGAIGGLNTGFSFNNPSSVKIYINGVITGLASGVVCIYIIVLLSIMVLMSIDEEYKDQYDNFSLNEVRYSCIKYLIYANKYLRYYSNLSLK